MIASSCRCLVLAMLVAVIACGGSGSTRTSVSPAGASDIAAVRALLERYSPTGSWILRTEETLPREFKIGRSTLTLTNSGNFASYFDDAATENLVPYTSTAVHETYHALTYRLAYQLQVEANAPEPVDSEGFYVGGAPQLVIYSANFPTREIDTTFPADARTFRYSTYVSPSKDTQSTQQSGVFGLLDEWAAYMHGAQVIVDFWPWVRDEAPRTRELYLNYRSRFHNLGVAYAEMKLYILHYLLHARQHHPDVHRALLANDSFRRAFISADDAWMKLLAAAKAIEPAVIDLGAQRGAARTVFHFDDAYPVVVAHLASAPYQAMLAELRGGR